MFKPLDDNILVKLVEEQQQQTPGGIYIPETAQRVDTTKPRKAAVVAVGPGRVLDNGIRLEPSVTVGDVVYLHGFAGSKISLDGEDHLVVKQNEILGVTNA